MIRDQNLTSTPIHTTTGITHTNTKLSMARSTHLTHMTYFTAKGFSFVKYITITC